MSDVLFDQETEIDERTKEELQPPCESTAATGGPFDDNPAEWILRERCINCDHVKHALRCECCKHFAEMGHIGCLACQQAGFAPVDCIELLAAERL